MDTYLDSTDVDSVNSVGYTPALAGAFIAEEIEFLLPDVLESLQIPVVLQAGAKQRLESSLQGKKGFRALPKAVRNQAVNQLKDYAFANVLRNAQQRVLTHRQANSTNLATSLGFSGIARTNSEPLQAHDFFAHDYEADFEIYTVATEAMPTSVLLENFSSNNTILAESETVTSVSAFSVEKESSGIIEVPKTPIELQEPIVGSDIRGLIALLRAGRVVAFVEEVAGQLVGQDIEKIEVPKKKIFAELALDGLMAEYHTLSLRENLNTATLMELRLIDALLVALENDEQWSRINTRRFHLITKKYTLGLAGDEDKELEILDDLAERQMYSAMELPFAELAMVETYAASVGLNQNAA